MNTKVTEQELTNQKTLAQSNDRKDDGLQTIPSNQSISENTMSERNETNQNKPSNSTREKAKILEK